MHSNNSKLCMTWQLLENKSSSKTNKAYQAQQNYSKAGINVAWHLTRINTKSNKLWQTLNSIKLNLTAH